MTYGHERAALLQWHPFPSFAPSKIGALSGPKYLGPPEWLQLQTRQGGRASQCHPMEVLKSVVVSGHWWMIHYGNQSFCPVRVQKKSLAASRAPCWTKSARILGGGGTKSKPCQGQTITLLSSPSDLTWTAQSRRILALLHHLVHQNTSDVMT